MTKMQTRAPAAKKPAAKGKAKPPTYAIETRKTAPQIRGRRAFFKYQDLGVEAASGGAMRAIVTSATKGMSKETGWHYHVCKSQFLYMIKGWVDLEMADGTKHRVKAGQTMFIPGGLPHNETGTSEVFELIEVCVPSNMGTVPCDPPAGRS